MGVRGIQQRTNAFRRSTLVMAARVSPDMMICPPQGTSETAFATEFTWIESSTNCE
jgi:hypothetical protein